MRLIEFDG